MTDEPSGTCTCCRRRDGVDGTAVCLGCRSRLSGWLRELPDLYAAAASLGFVERDGRAGRRAVAVAYDLATRRRHLVYEDGPADPVAYALVAGPLGARSGAARVSGSHAAPVPISIDAADLTAAAHRGTVVDANHDQIGHLPVAAVLDSWVDDWRVHRGKGEGAPEPRVPVLCRWLRDRLDDVCDTHPAMDDFADELRGLRTALYGVLGMFDVPEYKDGVRCRSCDVLNLWQSGGSDYVECNSCGLLLSPSEYADWTGLLAAGVRRRAV